MKQECMCSRRLQNAAVLGLLSSRPYISEVVSRFGGLQLALRHVAPYTRASPPIKTIAWPLAQLRNPTARAFGDDHRQVAYFYKLHPSTLLSSTHSFTTC